MKLKSLIICVMYTLVFTLSTQTIYADIASSNVNLDIGNGWRITPESLEKSDYNLNPYNNKKGYRVVKKK